MTIKAIIKLRQKKDEIKEQIDKEIKETYPVGTMITYDKNGRTVTGKVLGYAYDERISVESHTGKRYYINFFDILCASKYSPYHDC